MVQEPDADDLRPLRRRRPALGWTTTAPTAASRVWTAREIGPAGVAGGDHRLGPARPRRGRLSRPGSSGGRSPRRRASASTIVCNADEGDSGTFADRMIMEGDPFLLIEGMAIAGLRGRRDQRASSTSARNIPHAITPPAPRRIAAAEPAGLIGSASTSRSASAPGPMSAAKRPRCWRAWRASAARCGPSRRCPAHAGLFGEPTVINNVLTLAAAPCILAERRARPMPRSASAARAGPADPAGRQRQARRPLRGRRSASRLASSSRTSAAGRPRAGRCARSRCGGPLGAYFPPALFDTPYGLRGLRRHATA